MGVAQALPSGFVPIPDHGTLPGLGDDDHLQYALLAGRALGQLLHGGTAPGETLELRGSADANTGRLIMGSGIDSSFDWTTQFGATMLRWAATIPATGGIITAGVDIQNTLTVNAATFILSALDDHSDLRWTVTPGFAVSTLFFARPVYRSTSAGVNPAQAFMYAAQAQFQTAGSGAITVPNYRGFSFAPILRTITPGDNLAITNIDGLTVGPLWNTGAGTTANFGSIAGVRMFNPGQVIFGSSAGVETAANYLGLDMGSITIPVSGVRATVRSALVANASNYLIQNNGGAQSDFGGGDILDARIVQCLADNLGLSLGAAGGDVQIYWDGSREVHNPIIGDNLRITYAAGGDFLFDTDAGDSELRFDFNRFAFGQSGVVGNQVGLFVAQARTVGVPGGWTDFLLTQAGNVDLDGNAMSQVFGWTLNAPSITLSAGSAVDTGGLLIAGNVNQGTNRYGLLVLSSPSGGTLNYSARIQGAAGLLVDGLFEHGGTNFGIFGSTPTTQPTIVGSRGGNAALASLLTLGATLGLWIDGSSA